jgi:hypothetical protein
VVAVAGDAVAPGRKLAAGAAPVRAEDDLLRRGARPLALAPEAADAHRAGALLVGARLLANVEDIDEAVVGEARMGLDGEEPAVTEGRDAIRDVEEGLPADAPALDDSYDAPLLADEHAAVGEERERAREVEAARDDLLREPGWQRGLALARPGQPLEEVLMTAAQVAVEREPAESDGRAEQRDQGDPGQHQATPHARLVRASPRLAKARSSGTPTPHARPRHRA